MIRDEWTGCYNDNWTGDVVPEAFSHPAKFSRGLINRIYQHAKEMGWVKPGDTVIDPFGGVALGGLDAMGMGLQWIGLELEEKFVSLGEQNIELWNRQLRGWHNLGTARIIQGDSRDLRGVIEKADLICSSPPFTSSDNRGGTKMPKGYFEKVGGIGTQDDNGYIAPGNLANMKEGDIDCVVSSPPYADCMHDYKHGLKELGTNFKGRKAWEEKEDRTYGHTPGQLGSMKEGSVDAVISSPPYEGATKNLDDIENWNKEKADRIKDVQSMSKSMMKPYSTNQSNLGNQSGNTFWEASKEIVQGCYDLLKPSGMAIWVLKDYIKAGKRVAFSQNWASLCESVGFEIVCWHKASLVKEHGVQITLEGKEDIIKTERMSFFRRLHGQKYPHLKILWEDVLCMKKGG